MILHDKCPLCCSGRIALYLRCVDNLVSRKSFDICRCQECGFTFTQGYPDEKEIGKYYESGDYISHDDSAGGLLNRIYLLAREIMLRRKRRMVEAASEHLKGKLLDIGCGTGYFPGTMKKSGWDVTGIEPNDKAREFGISRFGITVLHPDHIDDLADRSFDCITMWHVLEHLHHPFDYAAIVKRLLKPDGICLVALPNCGSADAACYGNLWAAYDVPRHLWHFNPATAGLFWEKAGFKTSAIRKLPLDVFYISILSEKNKNSAYPVIKGAMTGLWLSVISSFKSSASSSLVYLLRKTDD